LKLMVPKTSSPTGAQQSQCTEIQSGATWSTAFGFYAAKTSEQVPPGYEAWLMIATRS